MSAGLLGEGYDCTWGTDFSSSYLGVILPKNHKHSFKKKKKFLMDGNGNTAGYKYYDGYQEASLTFEPAAVSGNTGTVAVRTHVIGTKIVVDTCVNTHMTGSWSIDSIDDDGQQEGELTQTYNISRYDGVVIA